jgi:hypothetical protein
MFNSLNTICSQPLKFWLDNQDKFLRSEGGGEDWPSLVDTDVKKYNLLFQMVTHQDEEDTGKSFSEALILASTNPQYDKRLFIELPVQHIKTTSTEHGQNMERTCSAHVLCL